VVVVNKRIFTRSSRIFGEIQMTKIIGIGYKKGVGKNTLAKFMSTYIRCTWPDIKIKEISFAAKLKDVAYQLYSWAGLKRGVFYELKREEKEKVLPKIGLSPRDIWIGVGNKLREVYSATWIDYALKNIKADVIIITDVRFENEAKAIQEARGILIKINRPDIPKGTDPAEISLDSWTDWHRIIYNNGTLQDLNNQAEILANEIIKS